MHSLPTRARAQLRATPAPARPKPRQQLTDAQRLWLARILALLLLAILGAALWPDGQTRPLSYSQPEPETAPSAQVYAF